MEGPNQANVASPDVIVEQVPGCQHEGEGSRTEVNNINSWVIEIPAGLCIYRVPTEFMDRNENAYAPKYVSFGPFHHKKLSAMEDYKRDAVYRTLKRLENGNKSMDELKEDLVREVQKSEEGIRDCYEGRAIEYDKETLAWMMTMDACFILEYFRAFNSDEEDKSLVFKNEKRLNVVSLGILMDILKLENQIPLFLLIEILHFELQNREKAWSTLFEMLSSLSEFQGYPFLPEKKEEKKKDRGSELVKKQNENKKDRRSEEEEGPPKKQNENKKDRRSELLDKHIRGSAHHLLDLCRKVTADFLKEGNGHYTPESYVARNIPTAELLHKAGIKFKPSVDGKVGLEKGSFACRTLSLPPIIVDDNTGTILLNVIAFEECHRSDEQYVFSHYVNLMSNLVNSEKDVALFTKEKIISNNMRSEAGVAKVFDSFSITVGEKNLVTKVAKDIIEEYDTRMGSQVYKTINRLKEYLEQYPWYFVSIVAGILLFGMTIVQTVYSVKNN
uniref:Uncharacterized protein n=1 Tax=Araucaria cunninghamii TaxID=56994 RepID=A0A0D6QZZ1_ARACU